MRVSTSVARRLLPAALFTVGFSTVAEAQDLADIRWLPHDPTGAFLSLGGLLLTTLWLLVRWHRVGRDPETSVIIPRFGPPKGMSPVAVGYVANMGFGAGFTHEKALAVALTSMAVKGVLAITHIGNRRFVIERTNVRPRGLSAGEAALYSRLFGIRIKSLTLTPSYDVRIAGATEALARANEREFGTGFFALNKRAATTCFIPFLIGLALAFAIDLGDGKSAFETLLLAGVGVAAMLALFHAVHLALSFLITRSFHVLKGELGAGEAILTALFILVCGALALVVLAAHTSAAFAAPLVLALAVFWIFSFLLRAPTPHGRKVMDEIEGYKLYLSVAESDRMAVLGDEPAMTLEIFERHLPYAMAMGMVDLWTDHIKAGDRQMPVYPRGDTPQWFKASGRTWDLDSISAALSDELAETIASASR